MYFILDLFVSLSSLYHSLYMVSYPIPPIYYNSSIFQKSSKLFRQLLKPAYKPCAALPLFPGPFQTISIGFLLGGFCCLKNFYSEFLSTQGISVFWVISSVPALSWSPLAAITKYYRLRGFHNWKFISHNSGAWSPRLWLGFCEDPLPDLQRTTILLHPYMAGETDLVSLLSLLRALISFMRVFRDRILSGLSHCHPSQDDWAMGQDVHWASVMGVEWYHTTKNHAAPSASCAHWDSWMWVMKHYGDRNTQDPSPCVRNKMSPVILEVTRMTLHATCTNHKVIP